MINYLAENNYGVMSVMVPMGFVGTIIMLSLNHVFKFSLFVYLVYSSANISSQTGKRGGKGIFQGRYP